MSRWITSAEAAQILTENSGRPVTPAYVRILARDGLIRSRVNPKDPTTRQFWEKDVRERRVRRRTEEYRKTSEGEEKPYAMSV